MDTISIQKYHIPSRLKLFLALSRTHHGLLDLATPGLGALLWLGKLPSPEIIALGLLTAFAGYTAVYALNDLVDYRSDQVKIQQSGLWTVPKGLDGVYVRHPMAHGLLSLKEGLVWTGAWGLLALAGAYLLNPVCALIFLVSCFLEATYCLLLRVTHFRTIISGVVKTSGGIAAVFAVDPNPPPLFLALFFFCIFFWEIGGQNVPSDWVDREEDRQLQSKTLPVQLGPQNASIIVLGSLVISVVLSFVLFWFTQAKPNYLYPVAVLIGGVYILLIPAYLLYKTETLEEASNLFSRASYYPMVLLGIVVLSLAI
ncbi:MAG: UbiA family prenyltransferase [Pseudomonadota bacterium]